MDEFKIVLAEGVEVTVRRVRNQDQLSYELYIADKLHGSIYPDHGVDGEHPLIWKSYDNIDPYLIGLIGKMIESHDD